MDLKEQYIEWHKIADSLQNILFVCLKNEENFIKIEKENFKQALTFFSSIFLKENEDSSNSKILRYIPFFFNLYIETLNKKNEIYFEKLKNDFKKFSQVFDFEFLFSILEDHVYKKEWERTAHALLTDDLYKTLTRSIINILNRDAFNLESSENVLKLNQFEMQKNHAKLAFQNKENSIGIIAFLIKLMNDFAK